MKLFDRIFHPEKINVLENTANYYLTQWHQIVPTLSYEQIQHMRINDSASIYIIYKAKEFIDSSYSPQAVSDYYVLGSDYKKLLEAKFQLESLEKIGLTDEQKLYLELIRGDENGRK